MSTIYLYRISLCQIFFQLQTLYQSFCADPNNKAAIAFICKLTQLILPDVEIGCGFFEGEVGFLPYGNFYCCLYLQYIIPFKLFILSPKICTAKH